MSIDVLRRRARIAVPVGSQLPLRFEPILFVRPGKTALAFPNRMRQRRNVGVVKGALNSVLIVINGQFGHVRASGES